MTFRRLFTRFNYAIIALILLGLLVLPAACSGPETAQVRIAVEGDDEEEWRPTEIGVKTGGTVRWFNSGIKVHQIVSNEGLWEDQQLSPGESFNFTFANAGTYTYHGTSDTWKGIIYVK